MRRLTSLSDSSSPTIRVVVLGGNNVGKSALIVRFLTKRFIGEYVSGTEITYLQEVNLAGNKVTAEICDALIKKESQDDLKKLSANTEAYLIVYNVCCRGSFEYACTLAQEVEANHKSFGKEVNVPILLVGNKSDLNHFREVKLSEGASFAKTLSLCRFIETSAAESYPEVEKAFRLVFQLIRKQFQASPTPSVSSCRHHRKSSISQVAQLIREHVRKQHSASLMKSYSLERGMSLSNYNSITCDNNNNSTVSDQPSKQRKRKKGVVTMRSSTSYINNTKPKLLSKCLSLSTLIENPVNEPLKNITNSIRPLDASTKCQHRVNSIDETSQVCGNNETTCRVPNATMKPSLSSGDDTHDLSDMSTTEDDAFLPDDNNVPSFRQKLDVFDESTKQQNGMIKRPKGLIKNPEAPHRSPKTSINKKGLHITIHSDGEIEEKEMKETGKIPPKSAPILRSTSGNKFRYFPNAGVGENQEPLKQPWSSLSNTTVPMSPLLESGQRQSRVKSPKEEKKSPHKLFKQFFKGTLYGASSNKPISGSSQSLYAQLSPASSETSLSTVPEHSWNALTSIDEQKTPEEEKFSEGNRGIYFHASSSSLSSIVSNETTVSDAFTSPSSVPSSPLVKKPINSVCVKPRRPSFRETVSELMRKRKKSNIDCSKHS